MKISYFPDEETLTRKVNEDCSGVAIRGKVAHVFSEDNAVMDVFDFTSLKVEAQVGYALSGRNGYYYEMPRREVSA